MLHNNITLKQLKDPFFTHVLRYNVFNILKDIAPSLIRKTHGEKWIDWRSLCKALASIAAITLSIDYMPFYTIPMLEKDPPTLKVEVYRSRDMAIQKLTLMGF